MAKKKLSVGVTAALIGGIAIIIAALVPIFLHQNEKPTQSISNGNGNIQAGRDIEVINGTPPFVIPCVRFIF
jgi:hypothetical protein